MGESTEALIRKLVFGLLGTLATVTVKHITKLTDSINELKVETSAMHQMLASHERVFGSIDNLNAAVNRIESRQTVNSARIEKLEYLEDRHDRRK